MSFKHYLTAAALVVSTNVAQAQQEVAISDLSWDGASAIAHVLQEIITGPMDSEAKIVDGLSDGNIVAEGMDKGDGSADIYTDLWMPNRQPMWDKYVDEA